MPNITPFWFIWVLKKFVEIISEGTLLILALHMSFMKIFNKVVVFNIDHSQISIGIAVSR